MKKYAVDRNEFDIYIKIIYKIKYQCTLYGFINPSTHHGMNAEAPKYGIPVCV